MEERMGRWLSSTEKSEKASVSKDIDFVRKASRSHARC